MAPGAGTVARLNGTCIGARMVFDATYASDAVDAFVICCWISKFHCEEYALRKSTARNPAPLLGKGLAGKEVVCPKKEFSAVTPCVIPATFRLDALCDEPDGHAPRAFWAACRAPDQLS